MSCILSLVPIYDGRSAFYKKDLFNHLPILSFRDLSKNAIILFSFSTAQYLSNDLKKDVEEYYPNFAKGLVFNVQEIVLLADGLTGINVVSDHVPTQNFGIEENTQPTLSQITSRIEATRQIKLAQEQEEMTARKEAERAKHSKNNDKGDSTDKEEDDSEEMI